MPVHDAQIAQVKPVFTFPTLKPFLDSECLDNANMQLSDAWSNLQKAGHICVSGLTIAASNSEQTYLVTQMICACSHINFTGRWLGFRRSRHASSVALQSCDRPKHGGYTL